MKIKKGFVLEEVGDSYLACATGKLAKNFSALVRLNETGAFLWRQLEARDMTVDALATVLAEEYDVSIDIAKKDVEVFIQSLLAKGIAE
jgi:hypothetical protein